jgi:uncharacterized membrane protein
MTDAAIYGTGLWALIISNNDTITKDYNYFHFVIIGITNVNLVAYGMMTLILQNFLKS